MHRLVIFAPLLLTLAASPAMAEKRVALVIGIDKYTEVPPLRKAVGDAKAVGAALEKLGFTVKLVTDAGRRSLNRSLAVFEHSLGAGDIALVHYSGHGVELDGENYLPPADIPRPTSGNRNYVKDEAIGLTTIVERLKPTGAATRILIVDACRDNPFTQVGVRSIGATRGLARAEAPKGTFIMYSAGYGQLALDRLNDADLEPTSVFTRVLLKYIAVEGREITELAKDVRVEVAALANKVGHDQFPAYYDELAGRFFLKPGTGDPTPTAAPEPADPAAVDYALAERQGTKEAWEAFLAKHGGQTVHIETRLAGNVDKYFDGAVRAHVVVERQKSSFRTECTVHLSTGLTLHAQGQSAEPYGSFETAVEHLEKRLRRYKRRLRNYHAEGREHATFSPSTSLTAPSSETPRSRSRKSSPRRSTPGEFGGT